MTMLLCLLALPLSAATPLTLDQMQGGFTSYNTGGMGQTGNAPAANEPFEGSFMSLVSPRETWVTTKKVQSAAQAGNPPPDSGFGGFASFTGGAPQGAAAGGGGGGGGGAAFTGGAAQGYGAPQGGGAGAGAGASQGFTGGSPGGAYSMDGTSAGNGGYQNPMSGAPQGNTGAGASQGFGGGAPQGAPGGGYQNSMGGGAFSMGGASPGGGDGYPNNAAPPPPGGNTYQTGGSSPGSFSGGPTQAGGGYQAGGSAPAPYQIPGEAPGAGGGGGAGGYDNYGGPPMSDGSNMGGGNNYGGQAPMGGAAGVGGGSMNNYGGQPPMGGSSSMGGGGGMGGSPQGGAQQPPTPNRGPNLLDQTSSGSGGPQQTGAQPTDTPGNAGSPPVGGAAPVGVGADYSFYGGQIQGGMNPHGGHQNSPDHMPLYATAVKPSKPKPAPKPQPTNAQGYRGLKLDEMLGYGTEGALPKAQQAGGGQQTGNTAQNAAQSVPQSTAQNTGYQPSPNTQQNMGYQSPNAQQNVGYQQPSNTAQQNTGYQQPPTNAQQNTGYQQPPTNAQQNVGYQQPSNTAQQNTGYQQPPNNAQQNTGYQQQPPNNAQQNTGYQQQPPNNAQQNMGYQQQPPNNAQQNMGYQQQPPNNAQQNTGYQQQPPNNAQQNMGYQPAAAPNVQLSYQPQRDPQESLGGVPVAPPPPHAPAGQEQVVMSNLFVTGVDKPGEQRHFVPEPLIGASKVGGLGPIPGLTIPVGHVSPKAFDASTKDQRVPCDLRVDAVFALDDMKNLWLATEAIRYYESQLLPSALTRFGVVLCGPFQSFYTALHGHFSALVSSLEDLQHANATLDPSAQMADTPGFRSDNNPYPPRVSEDFRSTNKGCLETAYNRFSFLTTDKTERLLIVMGTKQRWANRVVVREAQYIHSLNISVLSLADRGLPRFAENCLRNMASSPDKFRIVQDNVTLHALPSMIGNAICRPEKADVTVPVQRTALGEVHQPVVKTCRLLNSTSLERVQDFGRFFGHHTDHIRCVAGLYPDPRSCACV